MAMTFHGTGSVWHPERHRFLRFVGGAYSTADAAEIALLKAGGYKHDPGQEVPAVEDPPEREDKPRRGRPKNA